MAAVNDSPANSTRRAGVIKPKKYIPRVDMTPMVDLGFLLITFFIMTTELSRPTAMDLYMPKDGPPTHLCETCALTVMVDENNLFYYEGQWEDAVRGGKIIRTEIAGLNNIREVIGRKQMLLDNNPNMKGGRSELMVLIKPAKQASHKMVVDMLD